DRSRGGQADPHRDGTADARHRLRRGSRRVLRVPARRPALLLFAARGSAGRLSRDRQAHRSGGDQALRSDATPALRGRADAGGHEAYGEGWALYAETLGHDMGFYTDPYSRFGALNYQIWRAVRLVVDTGIHAFGWSRPQAIDYFKANSAKPEREIVVEIDRYIASPGQALAYKIGQRKFLELRERAARELGARFDLRAFHDAVLAEGALPLDVLEARIDAWIAQRKASGTTP